MTTQIKIKKSNKHVSSMALMGAQAAKDATSAKPVVEDIELPTSLKALTMKQLVALHNQFAEVLKIDTLKAFAGKGKAVARVEKLAKEADELGVFDEPKPTKKVKSHGKVPKADKKTDEAPKAKGRASTKKFTFGKNVSTYEVKAMITETFGDTFTTNKVEFVDAHYWYCTLRLKGSKLVAKKVRVDYLVNYLRIPRIFKESRKAILETATKLSGE